MNKEFKLGLFVTVCVVMLYLGLNYLKGINFLSPSNRYYALYDNVDQLAVSNPVLINGYAVGRVSNIAILQSERGRVIVELEVDSEIILGDSSVAILNADFLGNKSILLNVGDLSVPLQKGDTLFTEVARGIFDMFTETAEPVANNIQTTLLKLDAVLGGLATASARLDTVFDKFSHTPDLLNTTLITLNKRIEESSASFIQTSDHLSTTLDKIDPGIQNFNKFSNSLKKLEIQDAITKIQKMLTELTGLLSKMNKKDNTMGRLLTEDSLYVNLNNLLLRLDTLAVHLNTDPKHFLAPLGQSKKRIEKDRRKK